MAEKKIRQFLTYEYCKARVTDMQRDINNLLSESQINAYLGWLANILNQKNEVTFDLSFFQPNMVKGGTGWLGIMPIETDEIYQFKPYKIWNAVYDSRWYIRVFSLFFLYTISWVYNLIKLWEPAAIYFLFIEISLLLIIADATGVKEVQHFIIGSDNKPYQKFRHLKLDLIYFSVLAMYIGIVSHSLIGPEKLSIVVLVPVNLVMILLIYLLFRYKSTMYSHFLLMYYLGKEKKVPAEFPTSTDLFRLLFKWKPKPGVFDYPKFLTSCVKHRLLEIDGGKWRFKHQIIQDHFGVNSDALRS